MEGKVHVSKVRYVKLFRSAAHRSLFDHHPHEGPLVHMTTSPSLLNQPSNHISDGASDALRLPDLQPRKGRLAALPTKAEAQASLHIIDAYLVEIPWKSANSVLK